MYPTATSKLFKIVAVLIFSLNFGKVSHAYGQIPPPPPPGGSELWNGTSDYQAELSGPCLECPGYLSLVSGLCYNSIFDAIFGGTPIDFVEVDCGTGPMTTDWGFSDLQSALNNLKPLPGGYLGLTSILDGIESGNVYNLSSFEWDLLVSYAAGDELNRACNAARNAGFEPGACAGVPIPIWLNFALVFSLFSVVYFNKNPQNYVKNSSLFFTRNLKTPLKH